MQLKVIGLAIFMMAVCLNATGQDAPQLSLKLNCRFAGEPPKIAIAGILTNSGNNAVDLTISAASFPYEIELFNASGIDVLARYRHPVPARRGATPRLQVLHLGPGQSQTFETVLDEYLTARNFPLQLEDTEKLRLFVAFTYGDLTSTQVLRSDSVSIPRRSKDLK